MHKLSVGASCTSGISNAKSGIVMLDNWPEHYVIEEMSEYFIILENFISLSPCQTSDLSEQSSIVYL